MKRILALGLLATGLLAGCGADEPGEGSGTLSSSNESTSQTTADGNGDSKAQKSLEKAAEHAKESAKHAGEAISESTESLRKEWSEMNEERHDAAPVEDASMPVEQPEADMEALKQGYQAAKKKTGELIDKAKKMAE